MRRLREHQPRAAAPCYASRVDVINLIELEAQAKETLSPMAYDYYASGAHDELTLRDNVAAFARMPLHYRVLVDVSKRDLSTTVLGHRVSMPILVAPTAFHKLACAEGELATEELVRDR